MKPIVLSIALLLLASTASADYAKKENGKWLWYYQVEVPNEWGGTQTLTRFKAETDTVDDFRAFFPDLFAESFRDQIYNSYRSELAPAPDHVWQLFTSRFVSSRAESAEFEKLLARLGDVDYKVRKSASEELKNPRWAPLAWTVDLKNRPPEVRMRVEAYRNHFHPLCDEAIDRLRDDPDYLRDCLTKADPILKCLIEQRLDELNG